MQKRVKWIDIAKGIAIVCVVLGHAGYDVMANFVYMFHLSAFIFLSGYFYREEFAEHPFKLFPKRLFRLYCLYFVYEIIFFLMRPAFFAIGWYQDGALYSGNTISLLNIEGTLKEALRICVGMGREPLIGAMWFVVMLIMLQIMYVVLQAVIYRLHLQKYNTICIMIIFIAACLVTRIGVYIPRFSPALFGLMFYHMGFCYKKIEKQKSLNGKIYIIAIILCIFLFGGSLFLPIGYSEKVANYPVWFLVTSMMGIFVVVCLAKALENRGGIVSKVLRILGIHSFDIMALHFCAFKFVSMIIIHVHALERKQIVSFPVIGGYPAWAICYTIVGILIPLLFGLLRSQVQGCFRREKRID